MEALFGKIRQLYTDADLKGRMEIQGFIRELQVGFYSDWDVVMRLSSGPLQVALARVGINLGLFETLQKSDKPVKFEELVEKTGASPGLLDRILRTQASFGLIKETGVHEYTGSAFTKILADANAAGAISNLFDVAGPSVQALPEFLEERKYKDITSNKDTAFNKAFNTDTDLFQWMQQHPKHMKSLGHLMALQRVNSWVDSYPVAQELASAKPDDTLLVDIGGGFGQQAVAFRGKLPDLKGRVVVQDIKSTLQARVAQPEGVEFIEYDFFQPQTIKGARYYYLRHVLHDWPDEQCVEILRNIIPAMGPDSRILVDELVLPESGVPWQAAFMDILMMGSFASIERTRAQWYALLEKAGLKILDVHQYDPKMLSVIVAVPN